jgi:hypothetical protein
MLLQRHAPGTGRLPQDRILVGQIDVVFDGKPAAAFVDRDPVGLRRFTRDNGDASLATACTFTAPPVSVSISVLLRPLAISSGNIARDRSGKAIRALPFSPTDSIRIRDAS